MRISNKSSVITGAILLLIAALFSISLLFIPLTFVLNGNTNSLFFILGDMLFSSYGFSSILIPVFLLVAGLSCFASTWTARRTMTFLTALIPFFTIVITENICRSVLSQDSADFVALKIIICIVTGIMLVTIEFLGIGLIADKVNDYFFHNTEKTKDDKKSTTVIKKINVPKILQKKETEESLNKKENLLEDQSEEVLSLINEIKEYKSNNPLATPDPLPNPVVEESKVQTVDVEAVEEQSEPQTQSSLITEEEYAALTTLEPEIQMEDELEWNNLPPVPETLPPEYDEDFEEEIDENDPALQFPPVEGETNPFEVFTLTENITSEDSESEDEIEYEPENQEENFQDAEENENIAPEFYEESISDDFSDDTISVENDVFEKTEDVISIENEADLKKKQISREFLNKYNEKQFPKSEFPYGIKFQDEDYSDVSEKKNNVVHKSEYPSVIRLDEATSEQPIFSENKEIKTVQNENAFNTYDAEEDSFDYNINLNNQKESITPDFTENIEENSYSDDVASNFNSKQPLQKKISIRDELAMHGNNTPGISLKPLASSVAATTIPVSSSVTQVFSDMENDIRKNQINQNEAISINNETLDDTLDEEILDYENNIDETFLDEDYEEDFENLDISSTNNNDPIFDEFDEENDFNQDDSDAQIMNAGQKITGNQNQSATNLTADELSDFFTAQEIENTPITKEIQGNPPKVGNRATKKGPYVIPSDLLTAYKDDQYWIIDEQTKNASLSLKQTLAEFNIEAEIIGIKKGPVVTMFEILPAPGVKLSKIVALQDNIALALAAQSVRIVAPIPGKQAVGIEVPNKNRSVVGFREIIEMDLPEWKKMAVPVILGKDILGKAQLIDLVKTPHMLIAGATGSGKSVCVNSLILSILYKRSYHDVKMILVDPKVVELKLYNNIPHLLTPVITEPKKALQALQYCLCEMERRYALLDGMGVRDISNYNIKIKEQNICTEKLPYIVVIIDEFADLMATSGKELENIVARLTAMSRAVGIHLVLATQRPSVNVITGLIKANIPTRIAFMVASRTDSNIIIDTVGAEKLLGRGDMLYASAVDPAPIRIQGTFVSDQEVENVVTAVKEYGEPDYIDEEIFVDDDDDTARDLFGEPIGDDDPLYDQALQVVVQAGKASASYIQRRLKIGYNRAARLVEEMEERGIVGPANGSKPREIIRYP